MRVSVVLLRRFFWFYLVVQIIIFIFATIANHRESSVRKDIIDSTHEVLSHEHDRMIKLGFKGKPPPGHRQCVDLESLGLSSSGHRIVYSIKHLFMRFNILCIAHKSLYYAHV